MIPQLFANGSPSQKHWLWLYGGLFVTWMGATILGERVAVGNLSPAPCTTLSCVASTKPAPNKLARVRVDDQTYIVWFGETKPCYLVASGPACYVFDERGQLVTWAAETGEGGDIEPFYGATLSAPSVELDDVLAGINGE